MLKGRGEKLKLSLGVVLVFGSQQIQTTMQLLGQVCPHGIFADWFMVRNEMWSWRY